MRSAGGLSRLGSEPAQKPALRSIELVHRALSSRQVAQQSPVLLQGGLKRRCKHPVTDGESA